MPNSDSLQDSVLRNLASPTYPPEPIERKLISWPGFGSVPGIRFSLLHKFTSQCSLSHTLCSSQEASLIAQWVKNPPPIQETQVQSLGQEDPLEKEIVIPSSIFAWEIPWTEKPGGIQSKELQRVRHNWVTEHTHTGSSQTGWCTDHTLPFPVYYFRIHCFLYFLVVR